MPASSEAKELAPVVNSLFPAQHSAMFEYTPSAPPPYGFVPWNDQKSITARVSSSAKTYPSVEIDLVIAAMSRIVMVDAVAMSLPASAMHPMQGP